MGFSGFEWDDGNREHCQRHGVSTAEIESLFIENRLAFHPDLAHSQTEERLLGIGRTAAGRPIFLAFTIRELVGARLIRPISARYMHKEEIESYEKDHPKTND